MFKRLLLCQALKALSARCSTFLPRPTRRTSAFTLIEIVVVVGITMLFTAMAIGYTRTSEDRLALFSEQAKIQGLLNRAKTLALQGFGRTEGAEGACYGARFDMPVTGRHSIQLFRVGLESNGKCQAYDLDSGDVLIIEQQTLDPRILLGGDFENDISFRAPDLVVFAEGEEPDDPIDILMKVRDKLDFEMKITISTGGGITSGLP